MEFLTRKQKQQKLRRLYFGYVLLSILVSLATYVLISTALGFEVLSSKGSVVQNGLLFIDSRPSGAAVYINGRRESNNTNAKFSIPESTYEIKLSKQGYRDWDGSVALIGGTVKFLTYPRLMPELPTILVSTDIASKPVSSQSQNKRWLVSYSIDQPNFISVFDLENPKELSKSIVLPASLVSDKQVIDLTFIEWSGDNDHMLVKYSLAGSDDVIHGIISRDNPQESINLTSMFTLTSEDKLGFWDAKKDRVYIQKPNGVILLGNTKDKSLSAQSLFADQTIEFFPLSKERAIYTTKLNDDVLVKFYHDEKTYVISTMHDPSKPIIIKSFGFNSNDYILLAGEAFEKTLLYRNFESAAKDSLTGRVAPYYIFPNKSTVAEASRTNRFVLGSDWQTSMVYDIEQKELYRYDLPVTRPAGIGWFDDARLYAVGSDKNLSVFDFNGKNVYELAKHVETQPFVNEAISTTLFITNTEGVLKLQVVDIETASR